MVFLVQSLFSYVFSMAKCDLHMRPGALRGRPHGAVSHGLAPGGARLDDAGGDAAGCGGWWMVDGESSILGDFTFKNWKSSTLLEQL